MTAKLRIGIDFDNTIIAYDDVFCGIAKSLGLLGPNFIGRKQAVRDAIRLLPEGEIAWQRLQGQVYGKCIGQAKKIAGVEAFLRRCRSEQCMVAIVSHKTEYGHYDPDRVNLRQAAFDWLRAEGLVGDVHAIPPQEVYFESTRAEKLGRIAALSLTHFIDDLEEVLADLDFPRGVTRILFSDTAAPAAAPYVACSTWSEIERRIFAGDGP